MAQELKARITADTTGIKAALSDLANGVKDFASGAKTAVESFVAAFAIEKIAEFFKGAVDKALEAEKAFIQVGNALRNIGVSAATLRPQLEATFRGLSDKTGVKVEDIEVAFTRLVERTGDTKKALDLLPRALDNMAARGNDAATAAKSVANENDGMTKAIRENMGIQGAAEAQNTGYIKTLNLIRNAWNDVLIKLGDAILKGDGFTGSGNKLVDMLKNLSTWIETHQKDIQSFRDGILSTAQAFGTLASSVLTAWNAIKNSPIYQYLDKNARELQDQQNKYWKTHDTFGNVTSTNPVNPQGIPPKIQFQKGALEHVPPPPKKDHNRRDDEAAKKAFDARLLEMNEEVELFKELNALHEASAADIVKMTALDDKFTSELKKHNLTAKERLELLKAQHELEQEQGLAKARLGQLDLGKITAVKPTVSGPEGLPQIGPADLKGIGPDGLTEQDRKSLEAWKSVQDEKKKEHKDLIDSMVNQLEPLGEAWLSAFATIGAGGNVLKSFADAAKKALGDVAAQEAKHFMGKSLGEVAEGLAALANPLTAGTAGGHFAAAAEFAGAAALLGALGGAVSGGSGGGGGNTSQATNAQNVNDVNNNSTGTIVVTGSLLDMTDPRQSDALATALSTLSNRRIVIQTG